MPENYDQELLNQMIANLRRWVEQLETKTDGNVLSRLQAGNHKLGNLWNDKALENLERNMKLWPRQKGGPEALQLLKLSKLLDVSMDCLVGNDRNTPSPLWMKHLMDSLVHLPCYIARASGRHVEKWKEESFDNRAMPNSELALKGKQWSALASVVHPSNRLRQLHSSNAWQPRSATVGDLIEERVRWVQRTRPNGKDLSKLASELWYRGFYEAAANDHKLKYPRIPVMIDVDDAPTERSLRIVVDSLVGFDERDLDLHAFVYGFTTYQFGPPLTPEEKDRLLSGSD